jgi:hypothetical protein
MTTETSLPDIIQNILNCEESNKIFHDNNLKSTMYHIYDDIDIPEVCFLAIGRIRKPVRIEARREISESFNLPDSPHCKDILQSLMIPLEDMLFEGTSMLSVVKSEQIND